MEESLGREKWPEREKLRNPDSCLFVLRHKKENHGDMFEVNIIIYAFHWLFINKNVLCKQIKQV